MDTKTEAISADTELIDQVVAWHNRRWWSRRIMPAQVIGVGVVALPFEAAGVAAIEEPATNGLLKRAWQTIPGNLLRLTGRLGRNRLFGKPAIDTPKAAFNERFIASLKPAEIARFAWQHGSEQRLGDPAWPQRDIKLDKHSPKATPDVRFLLTAAVEADGRRLRVLIGQGDKPQIIGERHWNRKRLAGVLTTLCLLVVGSAMPMLWPSATTDAPIALAAVDAVVAEASAAASAAASVAPSVASAPASAVEQASEQSAADSAHATAALEDRQPHAEAADPAASAVLAASAEATETEAQTPKPAHADQEYAAKPPRADTPPSRPTTQRARKSAETPTTNASSGQVYAIATKPTRTRVASQLRIALLGMPTEPQPGVAHAEVMKIGSKWRAVIWPYPSQDAAENIRQAMAARGVEVEVIGF